MSNKTEYEITKKSNPNAVHNKCSLVASCMRAYGRQTVRQRACLHACRQAARREAVTVRRSAILCGIHLGRRTVGLPHGHMSGCLLTILIIRRTRSRIKCLCLRDDDVDGRCRSNRSKDGQLIDWTPLPKRVSSSAGPSRVAAGIPPDLRLVGR